MSTAAATKSSTPTASKSSCTGSDAGATGSTTITNGRLRAHAQGDQTDPPHDEGFLAIPTNPVPGYTLEGHLHLGAASQERFRYVFNEQVTNPDGSLSVNAVHAHLRGRRSKASWSSASPCGAVPSFVPADAAAVVLNVTGVSATKDGFVTAWPCGTTRPLASNLNLTTGAIVPNLVISKLGADGKVCLYTSGGTHLLADVSGYFPAALG